MNTITLEQKRFVIRVDWGSAIMSDIRKIPGRRVETELGAWSVPLAYAAYVKELSDHHGITMDQRTTVALKGLSAHPAPMIDFVGNAFLVRFDFSNQKMVKSLLTISMTKWFQPGQCWLVQAGRAIQLGAWAEQWSASLTPLAEEAVARCHERHYRFEKSAARQTNWQPKPGMGIELYDYQRAGIEYILEAGGRCIVGDEPGVGKTAQAMGAIHELDAYPAIINCPANLKVNWRRELVRALPGKSVEILRGRNGGNRLIWPDIIVVNYDILQDWLPYLPQPKAVIHDESHRIKNPAIERTRASIALSERVPNGTGLRLCLTGTPVPNKTHEILTQLKAVGVMDQFGGERGAKKRWDGKGVALNRLMRETCYLRRKKADVWVDMPERRWVDLYVEGDPKIMEEYRTAEANIVKYIGEKARAAALASGETSEAAKDEAWRAAMKASAAEYLVAISQLKQITARAALPAMKEWATDFLQSGEKLGVFAWHTVIVDEMAKALHGVKLQGSTSQAGRTSAIDRFQNDPEVKVFCGQILAAGEGITLTAASNAVLMEQPWNAAAMDQVLDRFHRRGQTRNVMGYVVLIEDTIGVEIQKLIRRKQVEVAAVVDGDLSVSTVDILGDLVVSLAERTMKKSKVFPG